MIKLRLELGIEYNSRDMYIYDTWLAMKGDTHREFLLDLSFYLISSYRAI